ncbi:S24/S26 family peptidase [Bacteroides sp.]|uniref:S24/S26 family peptidase n=1 Tax=Bacteroides sp. TaxID=29523 RepID=UPI002613FE37|nr:S24/S26 family peptidase [Bacteroides sp.]MDD3038788.1 S24/S26 family peptidase [Bacteroides sp.]
MQRIVLPNDVLLPEVTRLLEAGETVTMKVKGNSMLPFITGGRDSVVLRRAVTLHTGDIVLARLDDGRYVLHRITAIRGEWFTLMGDGNLYGTETCMRHSIAGQAIRVIKGSRTIDCTLPTQLRKAKLWKVLLPIRRYLLAIYKRAF